MMGGELCADWIYHEANLCGANLTGALLNEANLIGANLRDAHLTRTDFSEAILNEANLEEAFLVGTIFEDPKVLRCEVL